MELKRKRVSKKDEKEDSTFVVCLPLSHKLIGYCATSREQTQCLKRLNSYVHDFCRITYKANLVANAYFYYVCAENLAFASFDLVDFYTSVCALLKTGTRNGTVQKINLKYAGLCALVEGLGWLHSEKFSFQNAIMYEARHFRAAINNLELLADYPWLISYYLSLGLPRKEAKVKAALKNTTKSKLFLESRDCKFISLLKWRYSLREQILSASTPDSLFKSFNLAPIHRAAPRFAPIDGKILSLLFIPGVQSSNVLPLSSFFNCPRDRRAPDAVPIFGRTNGTEIHFCYTKKIKKN